MTLTDILGQLGVQYITQGHRHCRRGWAQLECPYCRSGSGNTHHRLGIHLTQGYANCWKCGYVRLSEALAEISGEDERIVRQLLKGFEKEPERIGSGLHTVRGKLELPQGLGELLPAHRRYLKGRGFDPDELVKLWQIQGIGIAAKLAWRIFIPILYHGRTVSWTTRSISDEVKKRYHTARPDQEELPAKELLFGEDYCRQSVAAVEGPMDVLKIGPGAAGTLGTAFTQAQVLRLSRYTRRIVIFDARERQANVNAEKLACELSCFPGETLRVQIDSKDPGSASQKELRLIRRMLK